MKFEALGDAAWRLSLPADRRASDVARAVRAVPDVLDVVATETAVAVYFAPTRPPSTQAIERSILAAVNDAITPFEHVVRVRYDGEDLDHVGELTGLSRDVLVSRHAARTYEVSMIGFQPGFGYLGPLDPSLIVPRRATPRPRVPAGAVAMAGPYTGVYPNASAGGWHLLGTVIGEHPFSLSARRPIELGDLVRFEVHP